MKLYIDKKTVGAAFGLILVILLFVGASFFANEYGAEIQNFMKDDGVIGMLLYVILTIVAVVAAPISTFPLIPIASMMWGWVPSALLSIIGWTIGGQISFWISRYCGKPLVGKLIPIQKLSKYEDTLPTQNIFWTVVFLRMILPVDILSYALGLFTKMKSTHFWWATFLGVTPFALVFAYAGTMPLQKQAFIIIEVIVFVIFATYCRKKYLAIKSGHSASVVESSSDKG